MAPTKPEGCWQYRVSAYRFHHTKHSQLLQRASEIMVLRVVHIIVVMKVCLSKSIHGIERKHKN